MYINEIKLQIEPCFTNNEINDNQKYIQDGEWSGLIVAFNLISILQSGFHCAFHSATLVSANVPCKYST